MKVTPTAPSIFATVLAPVERQRADGGMGISIKHGGSIHLPTATGQFVLLGAGRTMKPCGKLLKKDVENRWGNTSHKEHDLQMVSFPHLC